MQSTLKDVGFFFLHIIITCIVEYVQVYRDCCISTLATFSFRGNIYLIQSPSTFSAGKNVVTTFPDWPEIHIIIDFSFFLFRLQVYSILDWKKILRLNIFRLEKKKSASCVIINSMNWIGLCIAESNNLLSLRLTKQVRERVTRLAVHLSLNIMDVIIQRVLHAHAVNVLIYSQNFKLFVNIFRGVFIDRRWSLETRSARANTSMRAYYSKNI